MSTPAGYPVVESARVLPGQMVFIGNTIVAHPLDMIALDSNTIHERLERAMAWIRGDADARFDWLLKSLGGIS